MSPCYGPDVDPTKVAAAAHSLGGIAALATHIGGGGLATVAPTNLASVAILSYPNLLPPVIDAARTGALPPMLLITGDLDTIAPPVDAQTLADAASAAGTPVDLRIWPGQDHPFRGPASDAAAADIATYLAALLGTSA